MVLREPVFSSGRKLRTFSNREMLTLFAAGLRRGPGVIRSREHLAMWYGDRRQDPDIG